MKRWVFNIVAGGSALLLLTMLGLWGATYWYHIQVVYGTGPNGQRIGKDYAIWATASAIHFSYRRGQPDLIAPAGWKFDIYRQENLATIQWTNGLWFYYRSDDVASTSIRQFGIPCWFIALVSLILLAISLRRRRFRSGSPSVCRVCGYDLRATPERCPECGAIPAAAKGAAT